MADTLAIPSDTTHESKSRFHDSGHDRLRSLAALLRSVRYRQLIAFTHESSVGVGGKILTPVGVVSSIAEREARQMSLARQG
jgi:hypothetical protein